MLEDVKCEDIGWYKSGLDKKGTQCQIMPLMILKTLFYLKWK